MTGATANPTDWAIRVDLTVAPWYGTTSQLNLQGTGTLTAGPGNTVLITGRSRGGKFDPRTNNTPITNQQTALVTICDQGSPVPPPPADPSWYTVTQSEGTWTDTRACVVVTATSARSDLSTFPFFFGWAAEVDLTAAKARITGAGRTLNQVTWSPNPNGNDFTVSPNSKKPPGDFYVITSGFDFALRALGGGSDSKTVTVCVTGS